MRQSTSAGQGDAELQRTLMDAKVLISKEDNDLVQ
jgi:hypothetical protein